MVKNKQYFSVELKTLNTTDEFIEIQGKATTATKDRDGDIVVPIAVDTANFEKNPIVLYQHDRRHPIGKVTSLEKKDDEILVTAKIFKDMNREAYVGIKNGVLKTFSIGFIGKDGKYDADTDTWFWTKTELLEISVVSIPANTDAVFSVKELDGGQVVCGLTGKCNKELKEDTKKEIDFEQLIKDTVVKTIGELGITKEQDDKESESLVDENIKQEPENEQTDTLDNENTQEPEKVSLQEVIAQTDDMNELLNAYYELERKINENLTLNEGE